jgi:hypothetical protein
MHFLNPDATTALAGRNQPTAIVPPRMTNATGERRRATGLIAYRIIAPTSGFRLWTSGRLTTSKAGEGTVRSAKAIDAPF